MKKAFRYVILYLITLFSCNEIDDFDCHHIYGDYYATRFPGMNGYSISKKIFNNNWEIIIPQNILSINFCEEGNSFIAKRVQETALKDTLYIKFEMGQIKKIDSLQYTASKNLCKSELVLSHLL